MAASQPTKRVGEVFTPTAIPTVTLVVRSRTEEYGKLRTYLDQPGLIVNLYGPSKTGKSVLCATILEKRNPIEIDGTSLYSDDASVNNTRFAGMLADALNIPKRQTFITNQTSTDRSVDARSVKGSAGLGSNKIEGQLTSAAGREEGLSVGGSEEFEIDREAQALAALKKNPRPIVIDDFHRIQTVETQVHILSVLKPALLKDVTLICISIPKIIEPLVGKHKELTDFSGRMKELPLSGWQRHEILKIAENGFAALNLDITDGAIGILARHSHRNPQLMQQHCLALCEQLRIAEGTKAPSEGIPITNEMLSASLTSSISGYRAPFKNLTTINRGMVTKELKSSGKKVNMHTLLLLSIWDLNLNVPIGVDSIMARMRKLMKANETMPDKGSITSSILNLIKAMAQTIPVSSIPLHFDREREHLYIEQPHFRALLEWYLVPEFMGVQPRL